MPEHSIVELSRKVNCFVKDRNWKKYHKPRDIAIALAVEASELLEIFQWKGAVESVNNEEKNRIRSETADVVIYALSMANACEFDLGDAVEEKIAANEKRFPENASEELFG